MQRHAHLFHLELERVRLRALLAVERLGTGPDPQVVARAGAEIARLDALLTEERPLGRAADLCRRLGLDEDDLDLLWTTVAVAADPRVLPHAQVLGGTEARRGLSLALYTLIADLGGERARTLCRRLLGPHPLLRDHILLWPAEAQAQAARPLYAPARTIAWLAGSDEPDEALLGAGRLVEAPHPVELDPRQRLAAALLPGVLSAQPPALLILEGPQGTGRHTAIATAAAPLGRAVMSLDLRRLPRGRAPLEAALAALRRECRLRDAIPVVADIDELSPIGDADRDAAANLRTLGRAIDEMPGPFVITASQTSPEIPVTRPFCRVRWNVPDPTTRRALWARALGEKMPAGEKPGPDASADAAATADLQGLAMRYPLGAGGVRRAVGSARLCAGTAPLSTAHLVEGVRTHIAERLGELAQRQEVRQTWDDLVLAPDILDQVKALTARVRHAHLVLEQWGFASKLPKGSGMAALFSGPPGTGKTMVAGLIARELDLELYQVDLSKIVSKWVGETEKQLARVFEAAEAGHALLLFDEADALFARRTEVKSAVDRYANLEVNYLLQRIESFGGVTILTTNLEASIDPALRRRLAGHVVFWPPDPEERERLWLRMLSADAPIGGKIDAEALSSAFPEMTGANIRNAVLAAAFLAAAEGSAITQAHMTRAARGEYASMGRVLGAGQRGQLSGGGTR